MVAVREGGAHGGYARMRLKALAKDPAGRHAYAGRAI
jgi:hypothetical protein